MKNVPMRFAGHIFRHNPSKLRIEDKANVVRLVPPFTPPDSRMLSRGLRVVSGEGELYGADCLEQYRGLLSLYERGERGILSLPKLPPMRAYLSSLSLLAENREDVLSFSFTFTEAMNESCAVTSDSIYTVAEDGESLWDIAYDHGTDIDMLVMLNPQIRDISDLDAGEKVRLC